MHAVEVEPQGCDHENEEVILILHSVGVRPTMKPFRAKLEINTDAAVPLFSPSTQKALFLTSP